MEGEEAEDNRPLVDGEFELYEEFPQRLQGFFPVVRSWKVRARKQWISV